MNIIQQIEAEQVAKLSEGKPMPDFAPGDTVRVNVKVVEGNRERIQAYEGVVIARKNAGVNSSFTVRKMSYGEGVERIFPLYSPRVESVELVRRGKVRRAKLYYLRGRTGKSARIAERTRGVVRPLKGAAKAEAAANAAAVEAASASAMSEEALAEQVAPPIVEDGAAETSKE